MEAGDKKRIMFGMLNSIVDPTNALARKNAKLIADGEEPKDLTENAKVQVTLFHRSRTQRDVLAYDFFTKATAPANFLPELSSIDTSRFSTVPPAPASPNGKKPHTPPAVHIHHKFIVIDADTASPTIYTGSANMSNNSVHRNDENLLEITGSPSLAQAYFAEFLRLYEHYRARAIWNQTHTKSGKPKPKSGGSKSSHDTLVLKRKRDDWAKAAYTVGTREHRSRVTLAAPPA
jgi:phosphatidylserine/phosphatidylglycerophosphate/cardiolipin synthase-like enzyme